MERVNWPTAELDPIRRLRVLAAGLPGTHLHEERIDAPFADVWAFVSDLERSAPGFDPDVSALRILDRDGERWRIEARLPAWAAHAPLRFDVTMRPGWCWMTSTPQLYVVGMAARPDGGATRYAHLEGVALALGSRLAVVGRPLLALSRARHRHHVPGDVARLRSCIDDARQG